MRAIDKRNRMLKRAFIVCIILSTMVLINYLAKSNPAKLISALSRMNPFFLLLGMLSVFLSWILDGLRVYLIADALDEHISVWRSMRVNIATAFSGNVVPMASMAAPPTQVFLLHREGIPVGKATAIVAVRTAASTLFFTITAPILFLGFGHAFVQSVTTNLTLSVAIELVLITGSVVALTTLGILVKPELGARLTNAAFSLRLVKKILGPQSEQVTERVARESKQFHESMSSLWRKKRDAVFIALLTITYWCLYFSVAPLLLLSVGIHLSLAGTIKLVAFIFLVYFMLSYLPLPTGSGVSELGVGTILPLFGISTPIGTVILVVWSFLCVQIYTLLGGAFFLGSLRKKKIDRDEPPIPAEPEPKKP